MTLPHPRSPSRTGLIAGVLGLLLAAFAVLATPASAEEPAAGDGWVRLAHFSPDTPAVDASLDSSDSGTVLALTDVQYGDVSDYVRVPAGAYSVQMLPAGGTPGDTPMITQTFTVDAGKAYTVAAVGRNASLAGTVFTDDLTPPPAGQSRIRLLQASVSSPTVTVRAAGGPLIAEDATFGTTTAYAPIAPGVWTVQLTGTSGNPVTTEVTVQPGTVTTLTVLDRDGALALEATVDSSGVGADVPAGGVETGGGSTATEVLADGPAVTPLAVAGLLLLTGGALVTARRLVPTR